MADTSIDPDLDMIIASMRDDFIADAMDKLDDVEENLDHIDTNKGRYENCVLEIKRIVHSLKGLGGSFGFVSISRIAHVFEDFLDTSGAHDRIPVAPSRIYIETMRRVLQLGKEPTEEETAMTLDLLPAPIQPGTDIPKTFKGKAMLLMPLGVQRKIIARELSGFGLRTTVFEKPVDGIDFALSGATDLVITTMQLSRMTGLELARALQAFERTQHIRVAVLSAGDEDEAKLEVPPNAHVIAKGPRFGTDLMTFLSDAGFV